VLGWSRLKPIGLAVRHARYRPSSRRRLNVQAEVKLPVYRSLANTQLDSSTILQVGISRSL
jgi:hypothetical protein